MPALETTGARSFGRNFRGGFEGHRGKEVQLGLPERVILRSKWSGTRSSTTSSCRFGQDSSEMGSYRSLLDA